MKRRPLWKLKSNVMPVMPGWVEKITVYNLKNVGVLLLTYFLTFKFCHSLLHSQDDDHLVHLAVEWRTEASGGYHLNIKMLCGESACDFSRNNNKASD